MILIVSSRFLELIGIIMIIFFAIKRYKAKYIYYTTLIVLISISISAIAIFIRDYFVPLSITSTVVSSALLAWLIIYVIKHRESTLDIKPEEGERCPVCTAFIKEDLPELSTLTMDEVMLFFDSVDHLIKFLEDPVFYIKQRKLPIRKLTVESIIVRAKDSGRFREITNVKLVEEEGRIVAYEKVPEDVSPTPYEEITKRYNSNVRIEIDKGGF